MSDRVQLPPLRDDGLPTLPTGEPVLQRWFVIAMLVLVPAAVAVTLWAALSARPGDEIPPAERRPPGDEQVTIDRGDAHVPEATEDEHGATCAPDVRIVGDAGARAAARRAFAATCDLLSGGGFPQAQDGLRAWSASGGWLRVAAFELTGVESSTRVEDGRLVLELNARFQFEDAARAAPAMIHQLTLLGDPDFPGTPISAETGLAGAEAQARACEQMTFDPEPPRGCLDVEELLAVDDPRGALVEAGYPPAPVTGPGAH